MSKEKISNSLTVSGIIRLRTVTKRRSRQKYKSPSRISVRDWFSVFCFSWKKEAYETSGGRFTALIVMDKLSQFLLLNGGE